MRNLLVITALFFVQLNAISQSRNRQDWIDFGSSHINKWLQIAPAKLGPNALPVPEMDYAQIGKASKLEAGVHSHFMKGDTAVNSFLNIHWVVVPEKVEISFWGYPGETFRMTNEVRNDRQIFYDDEGWITSQGDLWISTRIQLLKNRKTFPDITLNYTFKNTTGHPKHGRYSDAGTTYFYAAFGKSFFPENFFVDEIRLAGMAGYYIWQTNKVEMAQDEGPLFEAGIRLVHKKVSFINEIGGYSGYDAYEYIGITGNNDPVVYRLKFLLTGKKIDWKGEFMTGLHDYHYNTFKLNVIYKLSSFKNN
ncbi:MAG TPA: hypothetical protein VJ919_17110 [Tangfeifania sp.]|nr:hypothetical protein [Tangfeifania sp.]